MLAFKILALNCGTAHLRPTFVKLVFIVRRNYFNKKYQRWKFEWIMPHKPSIIGIYPGVNTNICSIFHSAPLNRFSDPLVQKEINFSANSPNRCYISQLKQHNCRFFVEMEVKISISRLFYSISPY